MSLFIHISTLHNENIFYYIPEKIAHDDFVAGFECPGASPLKSKIIINGNWYFKLSTYCPGALAWHSFVSVRIWMDLALEFIIGFR